MKHHFAILLILAFALPILHGADDAVLNLWSGKSYDFPGNGKWQIVAKHGRVLASGDGRIHFQLPALQAGAILEAYLKTGTEKRKLCFYSPRLFAGIPITALGLSLKYEKFLQKAGFIFKEKTRQDIVFSSYIADDFSGKIMFVFPGKEDFPLKLDGKWTTISLHRTKNSGCLSVLYDEKDKVLDNNGKCTYAILKKNGRVVIVFSPDFELENIENILVIKYIIENNIHNKGAEK